MTCMTLMLPGGKRPNPSEDVSMVKRVCCWLDTSLVSQPSALAAVERVLSLLFTAPAEVFLFKWVLMCLDRWSLRMKRLGHSGHENFFSPVCVLLCRCSSSDRVKRFPQKDQEQTKGLSPVCQRKCARRWDVFPYTFPHPGIWQMCCFFLLGSLRPSPSLQ